MQQLTSLIYPDPQAANTALQSVLNLGVAREDVFLINNATIHEVEQRERRTSAPQTDREAVEQFTSEYAAGPVTAESLHARFEELGLNINEVHEFAAQIAKGGTLVIVRGDNEQMSRVSEVLRQAEH